MVYRLPKTKWCHCARCISTSINWHLLGLPYRGKTFVHTWLAKWILADCHGWKRSIKNSIFHEIWAFWIHKKAIWIVQCTTYILMLHGTYTVWPAMENFAHLLDVIVHSSTFEVHVGRLEEVLSRLQNAEPKLKPKLKPSKCHLLHSEVLFLRHIVDSEGVRTNPQLVHSGSNWKTPKNPSEVQQFLGLCNYYQRFVISSSHFIC